MRAKQQYGSVRSGSVEGRQQLIILIQRKKTSRIDGGAPEVGQKSSAVETLQMIVTKTLMLDFLQESVLIGTFLTLHATDEIDENFPVKNYPLYGN